MKEYLQQIIKENKAGKSIGITSICSANRYVIEASILNAKKQNQFILIESTSNQVNQYGGYTDMKPEDFKNFVLNTAKSFNFPVDKIILGGDHLGPNAWRDEASSTAMEKAKVQVAEYIKAGYSKIHLDTSMKLADDGDLDLQLDNTVIAERAALLCQTAENTYKNFKGKGKPIYIIGSDVPPPGGETVYQDIRVTSPEEVDETIEITRKAFYKYGLEDAWERVTAVVVQPGVEFSSSNIFDYCDEKTKKLIQKIQEKENLAYEAHSTDFQKKNSLKKMVENYFAILKVGPWLTFSFREEVFALSKIEEELSAKIKSIQLSQIVEIIDEQMKRHPKFWEKYYKGSESEKLFDRKFSYSDRIRYYWSNRKVIESLMKLFSNLSVNKIPPALINQYLPNQYKAIRENEIENKPIEIVYHKIKEVLEIYNYATSGGNL